MPNASPSPKIHTNFSSDSPIPDRIPDESTLPARRRQIFEFLRGFYIKEGVCPTVEEIGRAVGLSSTSSVSFHLAKLEQGRFIRRTGRGHRKLVPQTTQQVRMESQTIGPNPRIQRHMLIPLLGNPPLSYHYVAPWQDQFPLVTDFSHLPPLPLSELKPERTIPVPRSLVDAHSKRDRYIFTVQSPLSSHGLLVGDFAIVAADQAPVEGQPALCLLPSGAIAARELHKDSSGVWLISPEESDVRYEQVQVLGRITGMFRSY